MKKKEEDFEFDMVLQYRTGELNRKERRNIIQFITDYTLNLNDKLNQHNTEYYFMGTCSKN